MRLTSMSLRNLFHRKVRTSLCVFGVALGITLIITVGATTNNYVTILKEMNLFYQGKVVVVARGSIFIQVFSIGGFLQESTFEEVKELEGVENAVPMIIILGSVEQEGVIQISPINITIGIPFGNWSTLTGSIPLKSGGHWPSPFSDNIEVVIGPNLQLKYDLDVDSVIKINSNKLRIVGVLEVPTSSSFLRSVIIMPLDVIQELFNYPNIINMIIVDPDSDISEKGLANKIETEIIGVNALTSEERNEVMEPIFYDIELWSFGIGSAISFINMVLVTIVSFINVSERRKELAILDAIGIPQIYIIHIVITETGLMGLFGSLLGIPMGMIGAFLIIILYNQSPISILLANTFRIVPPTMIISIILTTCALSCIAGLISSLTISRKNITEMMRTEY